VLFRRRCRTWARPPPLLIHIVVHPLPGLLASLHGRRLVRMEASGEFGGAWQQPARPRRWFGGRPPPRTTSDKDETRKEGQRRWVIVVEPRISSLKPLPAACCLLLTAHCSLATLRTYHHQSFCSASSSNTVAAKCSTRPVFCASLRSDMEATNRAICADEIVDQLGITRLRVSFLQIVDGDTDFVLDINARKRLR
jgi:hypothetical protein